jgi:hypothetical protein
VTERVPVVPVVVTQANCEAIAGLTPRQFLDLTRAHPELCTALGKIRAVPVEDLLRFLRTHRAAEVGADEDVDNVLAMVGRRR